MNKTNVSSVSIQTYRAEILEYVGSTDSMKWTLLGIYNSEKQALGLLKKPGFVRVFKCGNGYRNFLASNYEPEDLRQTY